MAIRSAAIGLQSKDEIPERKALPGSSTRSIKPFNWVGSLPHHIGKPIIR
jgi:hypothetical protein